MIEEELKMHEEEYNADNMQIDPIQIEVAPMPFWKVSEVSNLTRVHQNTIRNFIRDGKISIRKVGTRILIPRSEVIRLLGDEINKATNKKG